MYQKLIQDKHDGKQFSLEDLNEHILRALYMDEEVLGEAIAKLFNTTKKKVDYKRLKYGISFIERVKNTALKDEELIISIHKFIFEDIYCFAGKIRYEDISKGQTRF